MASLSPQSYLILDVSKVYFLEPTGNGLPRGMLNLRVAESERSCPTDAKEIRGSSKTILGRNALR